MPRSFNKTLLFINSIFVLAATAVLAAQDTSATVSGEIRDASGAAISFGDADLRLQASPHTLFSVGTKEDGRFKFTVLPAGAYTLSVSILGFYGLTVKSIQLASGEQKILLPLRLDVAPSGCAAGPIVEYIELLPTAQNVGNLKGRVVRDGASPYRQCDCDAALRGTTDLRPNEDEHQRRVHLFESYAGTTIYDALQSTRLLFSV